jgi:hypothetical protein
MFSNQALPQGELEVFHGHDSSNPYPSSGGFPERQADVLAHVVVESHDDLVTQADLHKLTGVVSDLASVVTDLAESQKELAEAQKRTEDRVEELAEAQRGTELAVADLAKQVGGLANSLGGAA